MLRRLWLSIMFIWLSGHGLMAGEAAGQLSVIQELSQRMSTSSIPITRDLLQEIAVTSYLVVMNVPFAGVQGSQAELEGLITVKNTLAARRGFLERLLALRMQEAIDCALLFEVNRRAVTLNGEHVTPPYQVGSVINETVNALFDQNAMAEVEQAKYILHYLNGTFTQFCQRKGFGVDDVLQGKPTRTFTSKLNDKASGEIGDYLGGYRRMDRLAIQDVLFMYTLLVIDRARDVRVLWKVFRKYENFYITRTSVTNTRAIDKVLASFPYRRRLTVGSRNTGARISMTGVHYASPDPHNYTVQITALFFPYFEDIEAIAIQHPGIFSWYYESGGRDLAEFDAEFKSGTWLELEE